MRPTLHDVAAHAGVGIKTVSRVANGEPNVSPYTRRKVQASILELGYTINATAANLRRGTTSTTAVLVPDLQRPDRAAVVQGIEQAASARGHVTLLATAEDPQRQLDLLAAFRARPVDGLITVFCDQRAWTEQQVATTGLPVVRVVEEPMTTPPDTTAADTVSSGDYDGAHEAVMHLLGCGHRRIAFLGDDDASCLTRTCLAAYRAAMRSAGLRTHEAHLPAHRSSSTTARILAALLQPPHEPSAIFSAGARAGVTVSGHTAGRYDAAHVTFDEVGLINQLQLRVPHVARDFQAIGRAAEQLLRQRTRAPQRAASTLVVPTIFTAFAASSGSGREQPSR